MFGYASRAESCTIELIIRAHFSLRVVKYRIKFIISSTDASYICFIFGLFYSGVRVDPMVSSNGRVIVSTLYMCYSVNALCQ